MLTAILWILFGVAPLSYGGTQNPYYDDTPQPELLHPSWMSAVPDGVSLSEVTVPGTHNTMAFYGGFISQCNSWPLSKQLQAGIRFLDIRVRHVGGNLTIHHGISYQWAHFGNVLEDVEAFLKERPTETVLMRLREELSETGDIYKSVIRYVHQYANWSLLWDSQRMPTLGEARGKLVVLQNFPGPNLGLNYNSLDISDDWKVPSLQQRDMDKKWKSVSTHLEKAMTDSKFQMFLTYASGASLLAPPYAVAKRMNSLLYDYLRTHAGQTRRLGIIGMDFPGAKLVNVIISFNQKFVNDKPITV